MRLGKVTNSGLTRHEERAIAKRYAHRTRKWRTCYSMFGRYCLRCWWREITGRNARDKAADLAAMRARAL